MAALKFRTRALNSDAGFTVTEVMVAIAIMGLLATATIGLYISGQNSSESQQHREVAITIANESMESTSIEAVFIDGNTGVSSILGGREKTKVQAAWTANSFVPATTTTTPRWDNTATASSTPKVPITRTVTLQGTKYTATVLIGSCYQPAAGGDCKASATAGYTELLRVIVVVSWTAGNCSNHSCSYTAATLIDTNSDLEWKSNG